jgi:hypothetical protein
LSLGHTLTEAVPSRRLALHGSVIDKVDRQQGIECGEEVLIECLEGVS